MKLGRTIQTGARILVAMSGGVDSALTAVLLRRAGYQCLGIHMRTHSLAAEPASQPGRKFQTCCSPEDACDARQVAGHEEFPFYVLDLEREFHDAVIRPFIEDYLNGRTPNPCVLCNNHLKLGVLLEKAAIWQCEYVATGHYARVVENPETGRMELRRPADRAKDQTYYLFGLRQEQLRRLVCPLGELEKPEVRRLARELDIPVHDKPDSQEICFVPQNDYRAFLRSRVPAEALRPGDIVTSQGQVVGRHEGVAFYTIGQRRGLGIAHSEPLYVIDLLAEENLVVVGPQQQTLNPGLLCERTNWIAIEEPQEPMEVQAQIRYRHTPAPATLVPLGKGSFEVRFHTPQRAVTPGQAVVFYEDDRVLGGGWIAQTKLI